MSVTDDARPETRPARQSGPAGPLEPPAGGDRPGGGQYDRTPPQDIAAEQCVLGGMLLSKDAIADVVEILKSNDFYRPVHATIFDAVLDLYGRGEPADPITVAAALSDSGDLGRVGGAPYLHTLIASVPTAANASYYARIVSERAVLRRLVEAGTRIVQLGYGSAAGGGRDVDDVVDLAQQAVYDVTERRVSEDFAILAEMLQPTLDEIEAVGAQGGVMTGVPTGFTDLDRLLNGLHPGQLIIVAGRPGLGKALALDTLLPTPTGWTTMGEVNAGDKLMGADGAPTTVVHAFDVLHGRPCYEVEFSDGTLIVADADHLWQTTTRADALLVVTTAEIAGMLRRPRDGPPHHAVENARPLSLPHRDDLPLPPYTFGVRLRGGTSTGARIPVDYLRASEPQRRELLAGLLDTDGTVTDAGAVRLRVIGRPLAEDATELIVSLGYRCVITERSGADRPPESVAVLLEFVTTDDVFGQQHKRTVHKERRQDLTAATGSRSIVAVRSVPSVPVRCVTVDTADHLYLAGRSMVPTHNSTASMDFARNAAIRHSFASAIFSLEMSKVEIVMRLLSAEAKVPLHVLRSGQLSDDDWTKLARRMGEISEAPLFVDDTPNMNLMEIRAKARRLRQRHDLKLIVVDYLQLMSSPKRTESRQQEVAELSRGLKLLAKEVECPVIAVSQLNRGPEQRTDKRPQLSDLRESGCLTADTTLLRADTGTPISFAQLLRDGHEGIRVWSLDEDRRLVAAPLTNVFPSGTKTVFRLTLASGRTVRASANHKFLTFAGWRELVALGPGDRLAVPRRIPAPLAVGLGWSEQRLGLLADVIDGLRPHEKRLPDELYRADDSEIRIFLRHLCVTDGPVFTPAPDATESQPRAAYSTCSRALADGVIHLLGRLGIATRLQQVRSTVAERPGYRIDVLGPDASRAAASDDVRWDRVSSIEPLGEEPVYDATVKGTHNFIADGIVAHNSIEQDADVVILLHRDDYYDKESPRAGEADFIVAKHRNGPTDTVTVAAQLHLSRFVDMAI